jgi:hypothetical protein
MRVYATPEQLAAAPNGSTVPEADAPAYLRTASRMVDRLLVGRAYATDVDGMPTDADVLQALTDAACAIAVELVATGATLPGASAQWDSVGIGSVSLSGRKATEGTLTILGLPVPAAAIAALSDVGTMDVIVGSRRYGRPLDRVAL